MLSGWGMDKAAEKGWIITVLASPMGKMLYEYLGYTTVGSATVQVEGENDRLTVYCLEYQTPKQSYASSWIRWVPWVRWWSWT